MPVYFDHNATTPLDPRVLDAMLPYLRGPYGNPSSVHRYGRAARTAIEAARAQVAALVGVQPAQVIWTSGATESNNLALKGLVPERVGGRLLYGASEHPSVLEAAEAQADGVEAISLLRDGRVDIAAYQAQLARGPVRQVAVMAANNETGVIQDCAPLAAAAHAIGAAVHIDAVQAAGKIAVDFDALGADTMSLSAHKIYGPKGVGALVVRPGIELATQLHGGGQEHGLRGGTENLPAIVGFGVAAELASQELAARAEQTLRLRQTLEASLSGLDGITIFAEHAPRLPNTVQFGVEGWEGEALLMALDRAGFAVSSGSACASGRGEPSHVLLAMGWPREIAFRAVRVSFGTGNDLAEVERFIATLAALRPSRAA